MDLSKTPRSLKYRTFAHLYKRYSLPLMKFLIKKMGGEKEAAEEVFSQTVEAALKGYGTFRHKSSYFTWVCKIALNKMADYYRNQINERSRLIAPAFEGLANIGSSELSPEEKFALCELRRHLLECLNLLPYQTRRLLYLKYWRDLSHREIAEIVGSTERAIEGKIYRAKQILRDIVNQKHPELSFVKI